MDIIFFTIFLIGLTSKMCVYKTACKNEFSSTANFHFIILIWHSRVNTPLHNWFRLIKLLVLYICYVWAAWKLINNTGSLKNEVLQKNA